MLTCIFSGALVRPLASQRPAGRTERAHLRLAVAQRPGPSDRVELATRARRVQDVYEQLLLVSGIAPEACSRILLRAEDVEEALSSLHLHHAQLELQGVDHPRAFLPKSLRPDGPIDVTTLARTSLPQVLDHHPVFLAMAESLLEDDFYQSVYWGVEVHALEQLLVWHI